MATNVCFFLSHMTFKRACTCGWTSFPSTGFSHVPSIWLHVY